MEVLHTLLEASKPSLSSLFHFPLPSSLSLPSLPLHPDQSDKVDYAKSMARGYLRSVGSGEYAPQQHAYVKTSEPEPPTEKGKATKWKRTDSDEFDF